MVEIQQGNLFEADANVIVHQVNCMGVMGSGLALQVKNRYPKVFSQYSSLCKSYPPENLLGSAFIAEVAPDRYVANVFGQKNFGWTEQFTDLKALKSGLETVAEFAKENRYMVALPYLIGCCRGGGKWTEVLVVIEEVFSDQNVIIRKIV